MRRVILLVIALPLLLGGCEVIGRFQQDGIWLHQITRDAAVQNIGFRVRIRELCWESIRRDAVKMMTKGGNEEAYRMMLASKYPPPLSVSTIRESKVDPASILGWPYICGPRSALNLQPMADPAQ